MQLFFIFRNMKHQELYETLKEYVDLYEHSNKQHVIKEYAEVLGLSCIYNHVLIKTGYKFSTLSEFKKLCNSDTPWPAELSLKKDPEIRINVFRWNVVNGDKHNITIWNDILSRGMLYRDIIPGKPQMTKDYLTSVEEIKKCIFAAVEGRYYVPIELSNIDDEVIEEDPDVAEDIADILAEDAVHENIDSYTNEMIEENDIKDEILF